MLRIIFLILCILSSWHLSLEASSRLFCPLRNTINPCKCSPSVVDCSNKSLTAVPPGITLNFGYVNLSYNQISHLRSDSFNGNIQSIDLCKNSLSSIPEDIFHSTSQLQILNISNNKLASIPENLFKSTAQLQTLDLCNNNLSSIPEDLLRSTPQLQMLYISNNKLASLPENLFSSTPQLQTLYISNNKLASLPENLFLSTPQLQTLHVSHNYLQKITGNIFNYSQKLQTLDLCKNSLSSIPEDILHSTSQLQTLNISNNKLASIPENLFMSTAELQTLDVSHNYLQNITGNIFNYTQKLQTLDLSNNNLTCIQGYISHLRPTSLLKTLDISSNKFSNVDDVTDPRFVPTSIEKLSMSRNSISQLPTKFFFTMGNTTLLDLSRNNISSINVTNHKFTDVVPQMKVLLLHRNMLTVIPTGAFADLTKLKYICLYNNKINTLSSNLFNGDNLNIYLFGNHLTNLSGNPFTGSIAKIHVYGNNLSEIVLDDTELGILERNDAEIIVDCKNLKYLPAHKITLKISCTQPFYQRILKKSNLSIPLIPLKYVSDGIFPLADTLQMEGFICDKDDCVPCWPGTFGNTKNKCLRCPKGGFYQDDIGQSSESPDDMNCKKCPNGTYVKEEGNGVSRDRCEVCPDGTNQDIHGGFRACRCKINYTRIDRYGGCLPCTKPGINCSDDFQSLQPGYYWSWHFPNARIEDYEKFVQNLKVENINLGNAITNYTGEIPKVFKCPRKNSCINNNSGTIGVTCSRGYRGWLCGKCEKGFYPALNTCLPCPTEAALLAVSFAFLLICIALCMVLSWQIEWGKRHKKQRRSTIDVIISRIKILLGFYQIVGKLFESLHTVSWVGPFELVGTFISYMELNLVREIVSPRCLFKTSVLDPEHKFVIGMIIPILTMVIPVLYYKARKALMKYKIPDYEIKSKLKKIKSRLLTYVTVVLFFIYPNVSTIIFNMYPTSCEKFHLSMNASAENATIWRLRSDYDIDCQGSKLIFYYVSAYIFTVVYVIAFPIILLCLLWKYRTPWSNMQRVDESETPLVEDQETVTTKEEMPLVVSHQDVPPEIPVWLNFLCENYRDQFWFWEIVELTRKSTQTLLITMYGWENTKTVFLTICISVLFLTLHARYLPMKCPYDQRLQLLSLVAIFLNVVSAAMKGSGEFHKPRNMIFFLILNTAVLLIIAGEVLFRLVRYIIRIIPKRAKRAVTGIGYYLFTRDTSKRERII